MNKKMAINMAPARLPFPPTPLIWSQLRLGWTVPARCSTNTAQKAMALKTRRMTYSIDAMASWNLAVALIPMAATPARVTPNTVAVSTFPAVPEASRPTNDSMAGPRGRMLLTEPRTKPTSIDQPTR